MISGHVQGIWFRVNTEERANKLNIKGWIRNNPDGTVEAIFEGEESKLKEVLGFCKHGPEAARVDKIEEEWSNCRSKFKEFEIKY